MTSTRNDTPEGVLEIGNHPPPVCGWSIQTTLVKDELQRRGFPVAVLNINESRKVTSAEYIDVQSGLDYLFKVTRFAAKGYRFHIHCNAHSKKGFVLSFLAALIGRVFGRPGILTFHGGIPQEYFPVAKPEWLRWAFKGLFGLSRYTTCDSEEIRTEIIAYGIEGDRVRAIPCVSAELLEWTPKSLPENIESFLASHYPVFFSYVRLRKEYGFDVLLEAMTRYLDFYPSSGFIWVGPSPREIPTIQPMVDNSQVRAQNILLLPNMDHDSFLTIMARCFATVRVNSCDGVCASVLESLALGVPVLACEDGRRPASVITYDAQNPVDLLNKLIYVTRNHGQISDQLSPPRIDRNTDRMVDLLVSA